MRVDIGAEGELLFHRVEERYVTGFTKIAVRGGRWQTIFCGSPVGCCLSRDFKIRRTFRRPGWHLDGRKAQVDGFSIIFRETTA